jgi:pimeloyl-ACP methyl ester carboxylesterase
MVRVVVVAILLFLLAACSTDVPPPEAQVPEPGLITLDAACAGATGPLTLPVAEGTLADGSLFEIYKPDNFNGRLMIFAHGYFDPYAGSKGDKAHDYKNLFLPNHYDDPNGNAGIAVVNNEVVCNLVLQGFALAWSSYNVNGYAVESGYKSTHELRGRAVTAVKPNRVYLMGFSLGGQIVATLMEKYATSYDGALPMCGPVAGSTRQLAYVGDARAVFDYGFPGVLPGTDPTKPAITVPEPPQIAWSDTDADLTNDTVSRIRSAVNGDPTLAAKLANVTQVKLPYADNGQLVDSWLAILYFAARGVNNAMWLAGGNPYGNGSTTYSGMPTSAENTHLNNTIIRYASLKKAVDYFKANYDTTGNISRPVLTLHTNQDPAIPFWHEAEYGKKVSAQKKTSNLAQQYVSRYGHCAFNEKEVVSALNSLITWAEAPSWLRWLFKPANGDVTVN